VAVIGDAYIVVKAITTGFESEVRKAASGINLERDGSSVGKSFSKGFNSGAGGGLANSFGDFGRSALQARKDFQSLVRTGYTVGPLISILLSGIGSLAGGFVALAGTVAGAIPSLVVLPGIFTAIGLSAVTAFAAFSGVSKAISAGLKASKKATADNTAAKIAAARRIEDIEKRIEKLVIDGRRLERDRIADMIEAEQDKVDAVAEAAAEEEEAYAKLALVKEKNTEAMIDANNRLKEAQEDLTKALEAGREEIQQIGFDAEDAALSEKRASITLEKARETLQRTQDLPPNSRARREAQLAFAEAELGLRRAKDKNKDLQKEQDKLAGDPKNTTGYIDALKRQEDAQVNVAQTARDALRSQQEAEANITAVKLENTQKILDAEKKIEETRQRYADQQEDLIRQIQDAYDDLERAMEDQAKANKSAAAGADAYADALAGLSPAARDFVKYMVGTFIPALKKIRDAVAETFLPAVKEGLEKLRTELFPALTPMMAKLGTSLGKAFNSVIDAIVNPSNIKDLGKVFEQSGYVIEGLGKTIGSVYDSILSILVAADPIIRRFTDFLVKKTADFAKFLNTAQADGSLERFFTKAGDIAAKWGEIIGNIFSGAVNVVKAIFAPGGAGDFILTWFRDSTAAFEKFSGSAKGQNELAKYFKDVAENSKAVLGSLGAFVKEILKAGADPNVKVFFDTLKEAAPSFGEILKQANAAAPSLAKFVVSLTKFAAVTLSTGAIQTFFGILTKAVDALTKVMENPAVKKIFDVTARIFAAFSAIGLIGSVVAFGVKVIVGSFLAFVNVAGKVVKFLGFFLKILGFLGKLIGGVIVKAVVAFIKILNLLRIALLANPIGAVVIAIAALVAAFVILYKKNAAFRELVQKVWAAIKKAIGSVIDFLIPIFKTLWDGLSKGLELAWAGIQKVWDLLVAGVKVYIGVVTTVIKFVWDILKKGLELAWAGIQKVWDLLVAGVKVYIGVVTTVIKFVWDILKKGLELAWAGIQKVWDLIVAGVKVYIGLITTAIKFVWDILKTGLELAWAGIQKVWDTIVLGVKGLATRIKDAGVAIWAWLTTSLGTAWTSAQTKLTEIVTGIKAIPGRVGDSLSNIWSGLTKGLETAWKNAKAWWNANVATKKLKIGGATVLGKTLPSFTLGFPQLAKGGTIQPSPGGTIARIAEAGRPERVEPLDPDGLSKRDKAMISMLSGGGTGNTINVYPSQGMNESELASMISRQIAFQLRRGGA
jgi:phage-related protein